MQRGVLQLWYDCAKVAKEEVDGVWFCTKHAEVVRSAKR